MIRNHRLNYVIISLFILVFNSVYGQPNRGPRFPTSALEITVDYRACLVGLTNVNTGIKTETIYESAEEIAGKIRVTLNGLVGLVNDDLSYLLEPKYEQIDFFVSVNDFFWTAKKNGKTALFDYKGQELVGLIYDEIDVDFELNHELENSLNHTSRYGGLALKSPNYFRVQNADKIGIIDLNGKHLFRPEFDKIELITYFHAFSQQAAYYWLVERDSIREILTFNKNLIYRDTIRFLPTSTGFITDRSWGFAYPSDKPVLKFSVNEANCYRMLNFVTGVYTEKFYFEPEWSEKTILRAKTAENSIEWTYFSDELVPILTDQKAQIINKWQLNKTHYLVQNETYGTIDSLGRTLIPIIYRDIGTLQHGAETFVWAEQKGEFKSASAGNLESRFDIYDENAQLVRQIQIESPFHRLLASGHSFVEETEDFALTYSPLLTVKKDGMNGVLNRKGEIVIPFSYEYMNLIQYGSDYEEWGYIVLKNNKYGIINEKNQLIYPIKYDQIETNWRYTKLQHFRIDGKSKLIDPQPERLFADYKVLIENADTVILGNFHQLPSGIVFKNKAIEAHHRLIFAVKNDSLYASINMGMFTRCDSNLLYFANETIALDPYLIDKSGHALKFRANGKLEKCPNYLLDIQEDTARILSFSGQLLTTLTNYRSARLVNDLLLIEMTNNLMGLRTKDGLAWLVEPKYEEIMIVSGSLEFWVKLNDRDRYFSRSNDIKGKWMLINDKGEQLLNGVVFNYPPITLQNSANTSIAFVGDKVGVLNNQYEFILPAIYDQISPSQMNGIYYVQKEGEWSLFHASGQLSPSFNELSEAHNIPVFQSVTYTLSDTLIGFIHFTFANGFEYLVEPRPWNTLADSVDLYSLFIDLPSQAESHKQNARLFWSTLHDSKTYHNALIPFNNYYIRSNFGEFISTNYRFSFYDLYFPRITNHNGSYYRLIPETLTNEDHVSWSAENLQRTKYYQNRSDKKKFIYFSKAFYSEIDYRQTESGNTPFFANYILTDPSKLVTFYDLFKSKEKVDRFFYNYLETYVNERQLFGPTCINFPQIYENYTSNFSFTKGGIYLYQRYGYDYPKVMLSYELIEPFLKNEIRKLGEW